MNKKYLPFFWDYQITKPELKRILKGEEGAVSKTWAMSRLLESAPYEEIWKYINLNELKKDFPRLKLKKEVKSAWQRALNVWTR